MKNLLNQRKKLDALIEKIFNQYADNCENLIEYRQIDEDYPRRCSHEVNTLKSGWHAFCSVQNCPVKNEIKE